MPRKPVEEAVHSLRIEIRRTLATLELLAPLVPRATRARIAEALRRELKMLSRLRDTHVHLEAVAPQRDAFTGVRQFHEALQERERRLTRKTHRELRRSGTGKLTRLVQQLYKLLAGQHRAADTSSPLLTVIHRAFGHVADCHQKMDFTRIATIHRTRIAFKNFRYMVEAAQEVRPTLGARQRQTLRRWQARMGGIQDADTLLARAEKHRRRKAGRRLADYCAHLRRQRENLVCRFAAGRMDLPALWPARTKRNAP